MLDTLAAPDTFENRRLLIMPVRRNQNHDRLAYHFLGRIAEDSLRAVVPTGDYAVEVLANNGIIRGLDDGGNSLRRVQGQQRPISRRREGAQAGHHAQVFRVEAATRVVRDDPDCADCRTLDVEGNQQSFLKDRLDGCPIGEIQFGDGSIPSRRLGRGPCRTGRSCAVSLRLCEEPTARR
jgi:hypothetical protein